MFSSLYALLEAQPSLPPEPPENVSPLSAGTLAYLVGVFIVTIFIFNVIVKKIFKGQSPS